ncbi:PREDICTED: odorant receptor 94a-like [Nicrophorus vespilloides]|uniref:Odorant receptor 94a-like n=1 Tax=Nicrophorus vespilloides TaxID=110193 RepID=A0ABM1MHS5_NICVS|nr:PREDICTED: odorant receptor 94a-like [Nicrophorus vespilloides]
MFGILGVIHSSLPFGGIYFPGQEKYYYFIAIFQLIGMYLNSVCNGTIDCVSVILMQLASNQFDVLKAHLKNIKYTDDKDVSKKIKTQIGFHQEILEYCELVEELLNYGILAQFLCSAISICFTLLQLIMIPYNFKMSIILLYLTCILCQLWMYCWFGHLVLVKSSEVIDACYMSEWYKCHPRMKSFFFLIMERSKKPTYFTAGKFFILSLTTFVTILKSSYSYFAVLQRMYEG